MFFSLPADLATPVSAELRLNHDVLVAGVNFAMWPVASLLSAFQVPYSGTATAPGLALLADLGDGPAFGGAAAPTGAGSSSLVFNAAGLAAVGGWRRRRALAAATRA
jgi:hypothetical protein